MAQPIMKQPEGKSDWMAIPAVNRNCPPGLEYLTLIDQIIVKQEVDMLEGWEVANKYRIMNSMGQQIYYAFEESTVFMRQCCAKSRTFKMHITDNNQQDVIVTDRKFKCCAGCCWCAGSDSCAWDMTVESPVGSLCGYIRQEFSKLQQHFRVYDENHQPVFDVWCPYCPCQTICCTRDVDFKIVSSKDGQRVPIRVFKQWGGVVREAFTRADTFGIQFPMDLDVKMKATLISLAFMIDILIFEQQKK